MGSVVGDGVSDGDRDRRLAGGAAPRRPDGRPRTGRSAPGRGAPPARPVIGRFGGHRAAPVVGMSDLLRDLAELHVQSLRCPPQDVEGLVGGDVLSLHEDADGLADHLAGLEPVAQVVDGARRGPGHRGVGGEHRADGDVVVAERVGQGRVEVERPQGVLAGEHPDGQDALDARFGAGPRGELRPPVLGREPSRGEDGPVADGVDAGPFTGVGLDRSTSVGIGPLEAGEVTRPPVATEMPAYRQLSMTSTARWTIRSRVAGVPVSANSTRAISAKVCASSRSGSSSMERPFPRSQPTGAARRPAPSPADRRRPLVASRPRYCRSATDAAAQGAIPVRLRLDDLYDDELRAYVEESRAFNRAFEATIAGQAEPDLTTAEDSGGPGRPRPLRLRLGDPGGSGPRGAHGGGPRPDGGGPDHASGHRDGAGVYLDIHGGGFYLGSAAMNDRRAARLAGSLALAVVSVDYRLARSIRGRPHPTTARRSPAGWSKRRVPGSGPGGCSSAAGRPGRPGRGHLVAAPRRRDGRGVRARPWTSGSST